MKVIEALNKGKPTLSFEFFPPKTSEQEANLFNVISELKKLNPDFVSVTYGAMGTTREKTFHWAKKIKDEFGIEPVAHLTCVAATRDSIKSQLNKLSQIGVSNILALRGDPPEGEKDFIPPKDGFHFAKELVSFIEKHDRRFCVGVAGFPEARTEQYLKEKINAGGEYVITQLFFDNKFYFDFVERCRKIGIKVPIIPGIMPITNLKQIKKMTKVCGATIPKPLMDKLEEHADHHEAIEKIGVEHAVAQSQELLERKVPGIHFFVMNQSGPITAIVRQLRSRVS